MKSLQQHTGNSNFMLQFPVVTLLDQLTLKSIWILILHIIREIDFLKAMVLLQSLFRLNWLNWNTLSHWGSLAKWVNLKNRWWPISKPYWSWVFFLSDNFFWENSLPWLVRSLQSIMQQELWPWKIYNHLKNIPRNVYIYMLLIIYL